MSIAENYIKIREQVPDEVKIVLACKRRTPQEIMEIIEAGATDLGQNYVQEGQNMMDALGSHADKARWHMIGPLQKNKINKALRLFDAVQTVHSIEQAQAIDKRAKAIGKKLSVYIEINSGREPAKSGLAPEHEPVETLARAISDLDHLKLEGIMTMGPVVDSPKLLRPYFRKTWEIFDYIQNLSLPNTYLRYLSMGMSDSYEIAIEEGSNMIRLGTKIFGPRL